MTPFELKTWLFCGYPIGSTDHVPFDNVPIQTDFMFPVEKFYYGIKTIKIRDPTCNTCQICSRVFPYYSYIPTYYDEVFVSSIKHIELIQLEFLPSCIVSLISCYLKTDDIYFCLICYQKTFNNDFRKGSIHELDDANILFIRRLYIQKKIGHLVSDFYCNK
jgi:hypothetical protein